MLIGTYLDIRVAFQAYALETSCVKKLNSVGGVILTSAGT